MSAQIRHAPEAFMEFVTMAFDFDGCEFEPFAIQRKQKIYMHSGGVLSLFLSFSAYSNEVRTHERRVYPYNYKNNDRKVRLIWPFARCVDELNPFNYTLAHTGDGGMCFVRLIDCSRWKLANRIRQLNVRFGIR